MSERKAGRGQSTSSPADSDATASASPYSTGGGGTVLEHRYGAVLLSHLLSGDPLPMLGDDVEMVEVQFQASSTGPVDDYLVSGVGADKSERHLSVGVRRAPSFVASDRDSVRLLAAYLRMVTDHWEDVRTGRWRLGLAVAVRDQALRDIEVLATIAGASPDAATFTNEVARPGRTVNRVRQRLGYLHAAVAAAAGTAGITHQTHEELVWRLLSTLRVTELRLEGVDQTDRSTAVGRLRGLTVDGSVAAADALLGKLIELAGKYASTATKASQWMLRRDLVDAPLARTPSFRGQWEKLDLLEQRLRGRTRFGLAFGTKHLELDRARVRGQVRSLMEGIASSGGALIVQGEPDVGKSSLALRAADQLRANGIEVVAMSIRDLPHRTGDLETQLGAALEPVLASASTGQGRLLVLDGTEAVLEGRGAVLLDLAVAGHRQRFGVVAITRVDGGSAVREVLAAAGEQTRVPRLEVIDVPALTSEELTELGAAFPILAALFRDEHRARLLARPGLVDLLLRSGDLTSLEAGPLSEADLFAVVWMQLVRHGERNEPGGPSPDAREAAMLDLARRTLGMNALGVATPASALPSLRSDGLLLPVTPASAWGRGDDFASDLIRDFALTRLFLVEGWDLLDRADAPRWAIRAVRLACQGALITAGPSRDRVRQELRSRFDDLASRHGARWAEIPLEAVLTLGIATEVLTEGWASIGVRDGPELQVLLRLAEQRYVVDGFGDVTVLAPLVQLAFCGESDIGQHDRYADGTGEQVRIVVLSWLRGLAMSGAESLGLRARVRDTILDRAPSRHDEFAVEAIAMLGPDLDARAQGFLLELAKQGGAYLAPAVEKIGPILSLSATNADLLIQLAEAYYIKPPRRQKSDRYGQDWAAFREGVRGHRGSRGIGDRLAAWYYGPFFRLLNVRPREALGLINRILDEAATVQVTRGDSPNSSPIDIAGLDLALPGVGLRRCVGGPTTWAWYRGSTTGPYSCVSALAAVERFADQLVASGRIPVARVCALLLAECRNLAMVGLVAGFAVRHRAYGVLEPWLVRPELWNAEFSRVASEGVIHVQGGDDESVVGRDRRRFTFREVAADMTISAMAAQDEERLKQLAGLGEQLVANAVAMVEGDPSYDAWLASVEGWAATFHPENYRIEESQDGLVLQFAAPADVVARLEPSHDDAQRFTDAIRLLNRYARNEARSGPVDDLASDIAAGMTLHDARAAGQSTFGGLDPESAVAAAAIVASVQGAASLERSQLSWAAHVLIEAALHPRVDSLSVPESYHSQGADRSAAAALPALGLIEQVFGTVALNDYVEALTASGASLFDEVRAALVVGARVVWSAPCVLIGDTCLHSIVWQAIESGLADCRLGDWDDQGRRGVKPLAKPFSQSLPRIPAQDIYLNRLSHPIVASWDASTSGACVEEEARELLPWLLETHRRTAGLWASKGFGGFSDRDRQRVARVLIEAGAAGNLGFLAGHADAFASNAAALHQLITDVARLFTYDSELSPGFRLVWREMLSVVLDAWDAGRVPSRHDQWYEEAVADLLPVPRIDVTDADIDATLARAVDGWLSPPDLWDLIERWIPHAEGDAKAVDAAVRLTEAADPQWQASAGLAFVERLINEQYSSIASRTWHLVDWLRDLRASGHLDAPSVQIWRRIVDGLAGHGDRRAGRLQQVEE